MESMDLAKLEDDMQTVQKQTAPLAEQLVSNIAALCHTHKNRRYYLSKNGIITDVAFVQVNIVIYSRIKLHQPPYGHQNQLL